MLELKLLIDLEALKDLLDDFYDLSQIPTAIFDPNGELLVSSHWTDLSTAYNQVYPEAAEIYLKNDDFFNTVLTDDSLDYHLSRYEKGLYTAASCIEISGLKLGCLFIGRFFMETPDLALFKDQAREFGLPEKKYLDTISCIPVISESDLSKRIGYLSRFITAYGKSSLSEYQRKKVEAELKESEFFFSQVFEQSTASICLFNPDGYLIKANPAFCSLFGVTPDVVTDGHLNVFKHYEATNPQFLPLIKEIFKKNRAGAWEYSLDNEQIRRATVSRSNLEDSIFLEAFGYPVLGSDEELRYVVFQHRNITERKESERAIQENEEKYRSVVKNAIEAICVVQDDCFKYFNPEAIRLYGYPEEELKHQRPTDLIHPDDRPWVSSRRKAREKSEHPPNKYIHRIVAKNGAVKWVDLKTVAISWEDRPATLIFLSDITEKKHSEELMIQTEKMTSIGNLAAGTAHELNNPLGGILQGVQNISRRLSPGLKANLKPAQDAGVDLGRLQEYLEKRGIHSSLSGIYESGKKAAGIISNMLQFSRKSESKISMVDLAELLEETIELAGKNYDFRKKYDFRSVKVIREIAPDLPQVPCSRTEIEQVILNLLNNAAWAMTRETKDKPAVIRVRITVDGKMVRIEITDNGPGIDAETRKKIFEPFFTTKPEGEGTGLGLSVCYMIISNNHRGTLEVTSEPGEGATFVIRLPLQQEIEETPSDARADNYRALS